MEHYIEFTWDHEEASMICNKDSFKAIKQAEKDGILSINYHKIIWFHHSIKPAAKPVQTIATI